MRDNKRLFELKKKRYLGSTDSGSNPDGVLRRTWVSVRKGRGSTASAEGRHFYGSR